MLGGSTVIGSTLTVGVDNPLGTQTPGSPALLAVSTTPAPGYPCGLPVPGYGMAGGPGELLIGFAGANWTQGPAVWNGPGQFATFQLALPNAPALIGKHVYLQGAILDVTGPNGIGLAEALDVEISGTAQPDLQVAATWIESIPVGPGEPLEVQVLVTNTGSTTAQNVEVEACDDSANCASATIGQLGPGEEQLVTLPFATDASWMAANPHFFGATVDPNDLIAESDETNNTGAPARPGFVVPIVLVAPEVPVEYDESFDFEDGKVLASEYKPYGPNGGPSTVEQIPDEDKGMPHPVTGLVEELGVGAPEQPRIDPIVVQMDEQAEPGEKIQYLVKVAHGVPMPRLPWLTGYAGRYDEQNLPLLEQRLGMFEAVRRARLQKAMGVLQAADPTSLIAEPLEFYTLSGTLLVEAESGALSQLEANPNVLHVESIQYGELIGTPAGARADMQTDAYFNAGATGSGFVAIVDSGIRTTHTMFQSPDHVDLNFDCINGNGRCEDTGDPAYDTDDLANHGTQMAAMVTGNSNLGSSYRGASSVTVDNFRVGDASGNVSTKAFHRGVDEAVAWGDHIINCSIRFENSSQGVSGSIADDADNAFDAGCVFLAGMGNDGQVTGNVGSPALAHKSLGIGGYDVDDSSEATVSYQNKGPTSDDRIKPDIQAPTEFATATNTSDTSLASLGGTSSATAAATGAATVLADWFSLNSQSDDHAGQVYAMLINSGPREWGEFGNLKGVGPFELPVGDVTVYHGSRNVTNHENEYVSIYVPSGATKIYAAIWWGENPGNTHRDIDLYLQRPDGTTSDKSISVGSVFEHLDVSNPSSGWRDVRIYGYDVPALKSATVYYSIFVEE